MTNAFYSGKQDVFFPSIQINLNKNSFNCVQIFSKFWLTLEQFNRFRPLFLFSIVPTLTLLELKLFIGVKGLTIPVRSEPWYWRVEYWLGSPGTHVMQGQWWTPGTVYKYLHQICFHVKGLTSFIWHCCVHITHFCSWAADFWSGGL